MPPLVPLVRPVPPCATVTTPDKLAVPTEMVAHVLSPRRKVVLSAVPVTAVILVVPMLVRLAPEPLKVVPVTVPVMLAPPAETVSPPAVMVAPPLLTVSVDTVGAVARTTLPVPVDVVVHWIAELLEAVQKAPVVSVPYVTAPLPPMLTQ